MATSMAEWYRFRGRKRSTVQAPSRRRSSTECFAQIDSEIHRIGQLVADARNELQEAHFSPDRSIAVSKGTVSKIRRNAVLADDRPPQLLSPLHWGSQTARTARAHLSRAPEIAVNLACSPTPPLTARPAQTLVRPPHAVVPTPPSRERPPVGEAVRRHLKGELYGCWGDLLDECYAASAHEISAVFSVDQTVQQLIQEDSQNKAREAEVDKQRNAKLLWATRFLQAVLWGRHTRKLVAAQEALENRRATKSSGHGILNYLNSKYTDDLINLQESTAKAVRVALSEFAEFDVLPQWQEAWQQLKSARAPEPGSCLRPPKRPGLQQIESMLELCSDVLKDGGQSPEALTLTKRLHSGLLKLRTAVGWFTESAYTMMRELPLEAVLKPLHLVGGDDAAELIELLKKARALKRVFEEPADEQERMKECELSVVSKIVQLLMASELAAAVDFSVAYEQLVLERHKLEVHAWLSESIPNASRVIEMMIANSYDASAFAAWKISAQGMLADERTQATKLEARGESLERSYVQMVALTQQLMGIQSELEEESLVDGWPCDELLTEAMVAAAELMTSMNEHHLKQIRMGEYGVVDCVMLLLLRPQQHVLEDVEQLRDMLGQQIQELLNMKLFDAAVVACRVSQGVDELYFCKLTTQCLEDATRYAEEAHSSVVVDAHFDVLQPDCEALASKLGAMTEAWQAAGVPKLAPGTGLGPGAWGECVQLVQQLMSIVEKSASNRIIRQARLLDFPKGLALLQRGAAAMRIGSEARVGHALLLQITSLVASDLSENLSALSNKLGVKLANEAAELTKCRILLTGEPTHLSMQMVMVRVRVLEQRLCTMGHEAAARTAGQLQALARQLCEELLRRHHSTVVLQVKKEVDQAVELARTETLHLDPCKQMLDRPSTEGTLASLHHAVYAAVNALDVYNCMLFSHQELPVLMEALELGQSIVLEHQMDGFTAKAGKIQELLDPLVAVFDLPLHSERAVDVWDQVADELTAFSGTIAGSALYISYKDSLEGVISRLRLLCERDPRCKPSQPCWPRPEHSFDQLVKTLVGALSADGRISAAMKCKLLLNSTEVFDHSTILELTSRAGLDTARRLSTAAEVLDTGPESLETASATPELAALGESEEEEQGQEEETGQADTDTEQTGSDGGAEAPGDDGDAEAPGDDAVEGAAETEQTQPSDNTSMMVIKKYSKCVSGISVAIAQDLQDAQWTLRSQLHSHLTAILATLGELVGVYQAVDKTKEDENSSLYESHKKVRERHLARLRQQLPQPASSRRELGARVPKPKTKGRRQSVDLVASPMLQSIPNTDNTALMKSMVAELTPIDIAEPQNQSPSKTRRKSLRRRKTVSKVAPVPEMDRPAVYDPHELNPPSNQPSNPSLFGWLYTKAKFPVLSAHRPSKRREKAIAARQNLAATKIQALRRGMAVRSVITLDDKELAQDVLANTTRHSKLWY